MWITLTEAAVQTGRLTAVELAQVPGVAGQGDSIAALIPQVCKYVGGFVARRTPLGVPGTIPEELADAAASIVVWRFVSQLPTKLLATDARREAYEAANRLLLEAGRGNFVVAPPETQAAEQPESPNPSIRRRRREFTTRIADGI